MKLEELDIPIARYRCKNPPKGKHRTFSLLPDNLIPYNRFSIDLVMYILALLILEQQTTCETLIQIDYISPYPCMISDKILKHLISILKKTRIKLILFFQQLTTSNKSPPGFISFTLEDTIKYLDEYPQEKTKPLYCGAYYLCAYYYKMNGSFRNNARFLIGTASQFCTKPVK